MDSQSDELVALLVDNRILSAQRGSWESMVLTWCKFCGEIRPVIAGRDTHWYACPNCGCQVYTSRLEAVLASLLPADGAWLEHYIQVLEERLRLSNEKLEEAREQCRRLWEIVENASTSTDNI